MRRRCENQGIERFNKTLFLNEDEFERWEQFRHERFYGTGADSTGIVATFESELRRCREAFPDRGELLDELENYAESIRP